LVVKIFKNEKGFFFAVDSLIAVVIAFIFIVGVVFFVNRASEDKFANLYLEKVANDILFVMNKNETLQSLDNNKIQGVLAGVLPKNLAANLNVTTFKCTDQSCNTFTYNNNINILTPANAVESDAVIARTGFVTFKAGKIDLFATAELRIWLI